MNKCANILNMSTSRSLIFFVILILCSLVKASDYNHPGQRDFIEVGKVYSESPYGHEVSSNYAVLRFSG